MAAVPKPPQCCHYVRQILKYGGAGKFMYFFFIFNICQRQKDFKQASIQWFYYVLAAQSVEKNMYMAEHWKRTVTNVCAIPHMSTHITPLFSHPVLESKTHIHNTCMWEEYCCQWKGAVFRGDIIVTTYMPEQCTCWVLCCEKSRR